MYANKQIFIPDRKPCIWFPASPLIVSKTQKPQEQNDQIKELSGVNLFLLRPLVIASEFEMSLV